jgi:hypothetical protein
MGKIWEWERERERERVWIVFCVHIQTFFFRSQFLQWSQSGYYPEEDLPKFGYKQDMKVNKSKHPSILLATYCNLV